MKKSLATLSMGWVAASLAIPMDVLTPTSTHPAITGSVRTFGKIRSG